MHVLPVLAQIVGALAALVGLHFLTSLWWAVLVGGLVLVVAGYLAERAVTARPTAPSDRPSRPDRKGVV